MITLLTDSSGLTH